MEEEVKRITLGLIVSWILGVIFALSGISFIFTESFAVGFPLVLASLILLPPINKLIKEKLKFELSRALKIILVIILFGIYAYNFSNSVKSTDSEVQVQPTREAQEEVAIQPTEEQQVVERTPQPTEQEPIKKVKSAALSIDRVQIQLANLYPTRVTVTNTGDVTINPKFDVYVYDSSDKEVCSGSPIVDEFSSISAGSKKTGEFTVMGCAFNEDGTYTLKVDLLDSEYNKLDTKTKEFEVDYWSQFNI